MTRVFGNPTAAQNSSPIASPVVGARTWTSWPILSVDATSRVTKVCEVKGKLPLTTSCLTAPFSEQVSTPERSACLARAKLLKVDIATHARSLHFDPKDLPLERTVRGQPAPPE